MQIEEILLLGAYSQLNLQAFSKKIVLLLISMNDP